MNFLSSDAECIFLAIQNKMTNNNTKSIEMLGEQ